MNIIETAKMISENIESRITRDQNGFYRHEIRFLPVESWEPLGGWGVDYISSVPLTNSKPYPYH